jgi:hypothetical protein
MKRSAALISINILIHALLLFSCLQFSCRKEKPPCLTCPPPETSCAYPPGNRNFTWRLDTVAWFPSTLGGVWAFSDDDAYLMGYIGEGKPPYDIYMALHWDGITWNTNVNGNYTDIKHYANDVIGDGFYMVSVGYWAIGNEKAGLAEFDNHTKKWTGYQFQTQGELRSVWTDGNGYFIAAGDNGMVYTKDGYSAGWMYSNAPTAFNFTSITGISKTEIYARTGISLVSGQNYHQYWKYNGTQWLKLYDEQDTTGSIIKLQGTENSMNDIAAYRCSITDSLKLYLIGWESFLLESKGQDINYRITNLSTLGLPLRSLGREAFRIVLFSPNDIWIFGTRYNLYQWNGTDFQNTVIPGLPNDDIQSGDQRKMIKTSTGKVFLPSEVSSQVYVVVQGRS